MRQNYRYGLFGLLLGLFVVSSVAQDLAQCAALTQQALATAAAKCAAQPLNSVCVGSQPVSVKLTGGEITFAPGDTLALELVRHLATGAADIDAEAWGIARAQTDAGLATGALDMVMFGDATMQNAVTMTTLDLPTLPITNTAGYDVNLRAGPGLNFATAGLLLRDAQLTADARSADGEWYRVRTDAGLAWVSQTLVTAVGDVNQLVTLASPYTAPMQSFVLNSAPGDGVLCGLSTSGLIVNHSGTGTARFQANGVDIAMQPGTLLVQANADSGLLVHVVAGGAQCTAQNLTVDAAEGGSVRVPLATETLLAADVPQREASYPFAAVAGAPYALINAGELACIAGVGVGETIASYAGPGTTYPTQAALDAATHYTITGYAPDDAENLWWRLDSGQWIPQSQARTAGSCSAVTAVDAPTFIDTPVTLVAGESWLPTTTTIYFAESGADIMTGQCNHSPLAICSHPAAIKPIGDGTFNWQGQEPIDYRMLPAGANTYAYNGRNFANNANLALTLSFTSAQTWTMTMTTVFDDDPACQHTYNYTARLR